MSKCVLCEREAIACAGHALVCKEHFEEYCREGEQYLPEHQRVVYHRICAADDARRAADATRTVMLQFDADGHQRWTRYLERLVAANRELGSPEALPAERYVLQALYEIMEKQEAFVRAKREAKE